MSTASWSGSAREPGEGTTFGSPPREGSGGMFDAIAGRYDLLNRLMSLGLDRRWRRKLVEATIDGAARDGGGITLPLLDLATGTADVALALARAAGEVPVVGVDPSTRMLELSRDKVARAGLASQLTLSRGDALSLPFSSGSFAASCIAFGIRNVPDRLAGLREMRRVTHAGGSVAVLELCEPRKGPLSAVARIHVRRVVPLLGSWLSGAREYRYLQRSMEAFPSPTAFMAMMSEAGLVDLSARSMGFGSVQLFVGRVPEQANAASV